MWDKLPNGGIEREIKRHLHKKGYQQGDYQLQGMELIAIERPGWKQIFEFLLVTRTPSGERIFQKGLIFDDHRRGSRIQLTKNEAEFQQLFQEWSEGMIRRRVSAHQVDAVTMRNLLIGVFLFGLIGFLLLLQLPTS